MPSRSPPAPWRHCLQSSHLFCRSELFKQPSTSSTAAANFSSCHSLPLLTSYTLHSGSPSPGKEQMPLHFLLSLSYPQFTFPFALFPTANYFFLKQLVYFLIGKPFLALRQHELLLVFSCWEGTWPRGESFVAAKIISLHDLSNPWPPLLQSTPQVPSSMTITICCLGIKHWLNTSFCIGHWTGRMFSELSS